MLDLDIYIDTHSKDLNDLHVGEWARIIMNSMPPVPQTPLSPYAYAYQVEEHGCALNGNKIKEVGTRC
jgi:hypothetical protein